MSSSVIPATTPVSWTAVPNGSAATPSFAFQNSSSTGIYRVAADSLGISTAGVQRVVVDASGNVGVGVSSPKGGLHTSGNIIVNNGAGFLGNLYYSGSWKYASSGNSLAFGIFSDATGLSFQTAPGGGTADAAATVTERMRIDASGNLLVGNSITSAGGGSIGVKNSILFSGGTSGSTMYYTIQSNTSDFYIGNSTLTRYAALINIGSFTAWSFGSDRRIKKDIEDIKYGLEDVLNIQPRQYKLKDNNQVSIGFIAQELKEVIPEAVTGEEVPFDDNDTPQERASKTMGVSKDTLIPVLVKAIQEQQAQIEALRAEVAALKAP